MRKKCGSLRTFRHFLTLFLESAETPPFVQINVFAVWPLRLDRKYTSIVVIHHLWRFPVNFPGKQGVSETLP